jgi:hypothetical protein
MTLAAAVLPFSMVYNGAAASGAKLYAFIKSTSTPQSIFTNVGLTVPATNPYVANADGMGRVYLDDTKNYSLTWKTSDDAVTLMEADYTSGDDDPLAITAATVGNWNALQEAFAALDEDFLEALYDVQAIEAEIVAVAAIAADVTAVADNETNINTVADALGDDTGDLAGALPVTATGSSTPRTLSDWMGGDSANVLAFYGPGGDATDADAINAALASGKKIVFLPNRGTDYEVDEQVLLYGDDVCFVGLGNPTIKIVDDIAVGFTILRVRGSRVTIKGITFDGNNTNAALSGANQFCNLDTNSGTITDFSLKNCIVENFYGYGLFAFNAGTLTGVKLRNVKFRGFTNDEATPKGAVQLVQPLTSKVKVIDCDFSDITGVALQVRSVNAASVTNDVTVTDCDFDHGQYDYTSIGVETLNVNGLSITGTHFKNARMGLSVSGERVTMSGCTLEGHTSYGIEGGNTINVTIGACVFTNFERGIILYYGAKDWNVSGCTFKDADGALADNLGWALHASATLTPEDYERISFTNNTLVDCSGVRMTRCQACKIDGNTLESTSADNPCIIRYDSELCSNSSANGNTLKTSIDRGSISSGFIEFQGTNIDVKNNNLVSTTASANNGCGICIGAAGTASNCTVERNKATKFATGVNLSAGSPTLSSMTVDGNEYYSCTTDESLTTGCRSYSRGGGGWSAWGDADVSLTARSSDSHRFQNALTTNRTVTLGTADAWRGQTFMVTRTGGDTAGPWTLSVGGLKSLSQNQWCKVEYNGSAWVLMAYGTL